MSQTFGPPPEQQGGCERREPGALADVLALHVGASAALVWEPWLGEDAIARHYGVSTRTNRRSRRFGMPSREFGGVRRYRLLESAAVEDKLADTGRHRDTA
jgi:hypothetical protein